MLVVVTNPKGWLDGLGRTRAAVYVSLFASIAAYFLIWPIWRAEFLIEIWPTESWNAYWQDAAASWAPIYPPPDSFLGNNYPPLSFYAVGLLGKLTGYDNLFVGRALSVFALASISIEVFLCVILLTGSRIGGLIGALWYVAIMARNSTTYIGTNDPQLAGCAIMGAALVLFLRSEARSPVIPLLLMVIAGFWKHNNIAIPITAIVWCYIERSRFAHRALTVGAFAACAGLATCSLIFGPNFIPNLLATRQYSIWNVLNNVGHLQWTALALVVWALWAISEPRFKAARFTALHVSVALASCLIQWLGHGVSGNAEFDLIIALGIGIGVTFARAGKTHFAVKFGPVICRDLIISTLLFRLLAAERQETALMLLSNDFRNSLESSQQTLLNQAQRVAAISGDVACAVKLVCRTAGKRFVVDEFKTDELTATGRMTQADISAALSTERIVVFDNRGTAISAPNTSILNWLKAPK